jgi:hypothetical protein
MTYNLISLRFAELADRLSLAAQANPGATLASRDPVVNERSSAPPKDARRSAASNQQGAIGRVLAPPLDDPIVAPTIRAGDHLPAPPAGGSLEPREADDGAS